MNRRHLSLALAIALVALLVGCAGVRSERQGVQIGRSICDLRNAQSAEEAERELRRIEDDLQDARRITGVDVAQDVRRIDENLEGMAEHLAQGNEVLLDQDVAAIGRNLDQAVANTTGNVEHFYQGVRQGLETCIPN